MAPVESAEEGAGAPGDAVERRARRRVLWLILGIAGGLLLLGILFGVLQATVRQDFARAFPVQAGQAIDVSVPAGDVAVTATGRGDGEIRADATYFVRAPRLDEEGSAADLVKVRAECGFLSSCDFDVTADVAAGTDVTLRSESGDLRVGGTTGVVDARSEDGDVTVEGTSFDVRAASAVGTVTVRGATGSVRAEAVAGDLVMTGISGAIRARNGEGVITADDLTSKEVEAEGGSGGVRLTFAEPPDRVEVDVAEGPAEIVVPAGRYRLDTDVNQGDLEVTGIEEDPDASRRIVVRTIQGDATIEGR